MSPRVGFLVGRGAGGGVPASFADLESCMAEAGAALSGRTGQILRVFANDPSGPHFARDICWSTDLSGGYVAVVLGRLERQGWLESEWEDIDPEAAGRPQRRAYRLSATGRSAVVSASWARPASAESRTPRDAARWISAPDRVELAGTLCDLAADALPVADRQRYRAEWRADVAADPVHGLQYALSILLHLSRLKAGAAGREVTDQSWFCRLHQHGYVTIHDNRDDWRATSHLCTRCGHIKDDWRGAGPAPASLAWASFSRGDS